MASNKASPPTTSTTDNGLPESEEDTNEQDHSSTSSTQTGHESDSSCGSDVETKSPNKKKARIVRTTNVISANEQSSSDDESDIEEEEEDLTKPDNEFHIQDQIFNNMFASTENIENEIQPGSLRPIVIDGSNVAFGHGNQKEFSEQGILICLDYFQQRGHEVKVFIPQYHHKYFTYETAKELEEKGILTFTPSRIVNGKRISSYDDRFTLQYATLKKAIVVSNDNYRDLYDEDERYHEVIRHRLLPYTWPEKNVLMFPPDPLGRNGPELDDFLRFPKENTETAGQQMKSRSKSRSKKSRSKGTTQSQSTGNHQPPPPAAAAEVSPNVQSQSSTEVTNNENYDSDGSSGSSGFSSGGEDSELED